MKNSSSPEDEIAGAYSRFFDVLTCFMIVAMWLSLTNVDPLQVAMRTSAVCGPEAPSWLSAKYSVWPSGLISGCDARLQPGASGSLDHEFSPKGE